jgi:hypothetical protein
VPGAVALVDGVVTYKFFYFFFGQASYYVEGTPLIDSTMVGSAEFESPYMVCYDDPETRETRLKYLTEEDYYAVKAALAQDDEATIEQIVLND